MWPLLLDMTKEESVQNLRNLELEAYSCLVSALRAQGPLDADKRKLLKETGSALNITQERHKAEVRRAISDEKLNTIAYHITGQIESLEEWAQEGRRLVPLLPRQAPQTLYSAIANDVAESASQSNKLLPSPANTERKRPVVSPITTIANPDTCKNISFRVPEPPKQDENVNKKRKLVGVTENANITHNLLSPKLCRIQQIYRQRSKVKPKELIKKSENEHIDMVQQHRIIQSVPQPQAASCSSPQPQFLNQRINVLQNITLQPIKDEIIEGEETEMNNSKLPEQSMTTPVSVCSNENQAPKPKLLTNFKPNTSITIKQPSPQLAGPSSEIQKNIKITNTKKPITKAINAGQKLIVVSNAQTIPSSSILQKTLQIPFVKNISIKNFEKFKIVTSNSTPTSLQLTNVTNSGVNSVKHKVVSVKPNSSSKKVIPLSQLQVLNSKGNIKVLPIGSKIVSKSVTGTSSPIYIVNTTQQLTKSTPTQVVATSQIQSEKPEDKKTEIVMSEVDGVSSPTNRENGKSSVLEDILKASGISEENISEHYEDKVEDTQISNNKECSENQNPDGIADNAVTLSNNFEEYSVVNEQHIEEEYVDSEFGEKEPIEKVEVIANEVIDSDNSLLATPHLSEEITTEEVPLPVTLDDEVSKVDDMQCN
ncbi:BRCA2-interacting transcriptional repressor EMSY isoform X1 [Diorhabda sublineata]|uniref:BRCA2-interacting transcriptional repressor EMSY isoform X1 n=1 Tax=Diorhabda sublineata TaxID=1163346 RepID=UPI0024E0917E|nr:BRCA2-interacting transcriptional repressor EMSY isoform X1 [Diorhabda sublineata]